MNFVAPARTNHKRFAESEGVQAFRTALKEIRRAGGLPIEAGELQDIRQILRDRGHGVFSPRVRQDPQELEPTESILRRMLALVEVRTFDEFDLDTSCAIDRLRVALEDGAHSRVSIS